MNAAISLASPTELFSAHFRRRGVGANPSIYFSSSLFRRGRRPDPRRRLPDRDVELSVSISDFSSRASASLNRILRTSEFRLRRFLSSGADAYNDLRTSVRVDPGHRIVFSCRRSSLDFVANLILWSFAAVLAARVLTWLWRQLVFRGFGNWLVLRRDRSLGGREVVVGRRRASVPLNPLSPAATRPELKIKERSQKNRLAKPEKLPHWWPEPITLPVVSDSKEEFQREANRLVRAIMDSRMNGMDYKEDDIIQLRQICRISGANVSFETTNARDSFYRAAVGLVLNTCSRIRQPDAPVQIDGEDVRRFISGLAGNIGLENVHAARLVRAAVAARTRSWFLQSWAFIAQGKRSEAMEELSKIYQIHRIFPFEENSPEMEMVASGLKKNLRIDQRKHLLNLFVEVCGAESQKIAAEALDLMHLN
ncbi:hypothetical protein J5N97_012657 [Dioscorea zingiberensis]|uniref:Uncharacterized protein n=1 Tax=Dioscorea zingiberensis TaxID=325984 RepID=A0A9D5CS40_9LILI|nr:hypothetical protein J5N97_012657 [Dioscorea zingiberensis]